MTELAKRTFLATLKQRTEEAQPLSADKKSNPQREKERWRSIANRWIDAKLPWDAPQNIGTIANLIHKLDVYADALAVCEKNLKENGREEVRASRDQARRLRDLLEQKIQEAAQA